jgi:hypothetical protein
VTPERISPRTNGHTPDPSGHRLRAVSDDPRGPLVAETAKFAADCATRDAYAELAPADSEGQRLRPPGAATRPSRGHSAAAQRSPGPPDIPPGADYLPEDGASFVEAVHELVDLIELEVSLLKSKDEKIRQRELAYLRELKYGKIASFSDDDDIPRIVFDSPDPSTSAE